MNGRMNDGGGTPGDAHATASGGRSAFVVAAIAAVGGLLFGYDTGVISGAILFIREEFALSPQGQERVVAAVLIGSVLGGVAGGVLGDRFGRRRIILLAAALFAVGSVATALAPTSGWLSAFRILVGVGIGIASFTSPLYIAEMVPPRNRGGLVFLNQLAITIGILVAYLVNFAFAGHPQGWRWMLGLALVPAVALAVGMFFVGESPRWLVAKARVGEARAVLRRIRGTADVDDELRAIGDEIKDETGRWSDLAKREVRLPLVVGIGLAVLQQFVGINTVIYYAPTILRNAGIGSNTGAILGTIGVGLVNVLLTIVGIWLVDRAGRRKLLLGSLPVMALALALLAATLQFRAVGSAGALAIPILMLYVAAFAVGMGPIFWLLIAEIYPTAVRARAMSVATIANWGANYLVAVTFLRLTGRLGAPGVFWLYAFFTVVAIAFTYFVVPETKGFSLEEIQERFKSKRILGRGRRPRPSPPPGTGPRAPAPSGSRP